MIWLFAFLLLASGHPLLAIILAVWAFTHKKEDSHEPR